MGLSTLLGWDRHPGEVAGWGPVTAEVARTVVVAQRAAEWRYALTDRAGQLLLAGITRHRPHSTAPAGELPPCRDGIVELHLPAALLTELAAHLDACDEWAGVVADLAAQYTQYQECGWRGPIAQDPTARFAGAVLRRHVQIRDRSCVYMGCRASARSADLDHTVDHTYGGPTTEANSGPSRGVQRQEAIELVPQREVAQAHLQVGGVVVARVDQGGLEPQRDYTLPVPAGGGLLVDPDAFVGAVAVLR